MKLAYTVTSQESKAGEFRALVLNAEGKCSYLGATSYKTEREAVREAANYLSDLLSGNIDLSYLE